uniref:C2H2-type domain-containing protein n=1 Tax=Knipowitschia caucasica TaxID=637954 RepID=A0AAV2JCU0_KNICA
MSSAGWRLHSELVAVIDRLVQAAVAELKRLEAKRLDANSQPHILMQFTSLMETLGTEALGKILSILDTARVELKLDKLDYPATAKPHVVYILQSSRGRSIPEEDSAKAEIIPATCLQDKCGHFNISTDNKKRQRSIKTKLRKSKIKPQDLKTRMDMDMTESLTNKEPCLQSAGENNPTTFTSTSLAPPFLPKTECAMCDISFNSESAFRARSLKTHMYKHTEDYPFKCQECGKGYIDGDKLMGHLSVHTGLKPFDCKVCGSSFTAKTNLHRHMRSHTGTKPYTCAECGRSFTRSRTLRDHMTIHSGVRPYKCSSCGRTFNHKVNLIVHERIHTGERPYLCSICPKAFRTTVALQVHQRVHTGEKPYICDVCGRAFSQQSSLCVHRRVHLNERSYVCHVCSKSFNNPQNLKLHMRVHSGERPYACGLCDKTFVQNAHLHTHMMHMHSGVKQCMCEHCGKVYADRRTLRVHKCVYK